MAKASKKISPVALMSVTTGAFSYSRNRTAAYAAIVAAGGDTKETRHAFMVGYVAAILNKSATALTSSLTAETEKVLSYVGYGAKTVPTGSGRRTKVQEAAYGAARTAWKVVNRKAGVKANPNKARAPRPTKGDVAPIVAAPKETTPKVYNGKDAGAFLQQQAAMLLAFANKNAKVLPIEARNAVGAFVAAVKDLGGE